MCYPKSCPVYANTPEEALTRYRTMHPEDTRDYYFTGAHNTWVLIREQKEQADENTRLRIGNRIAELRKERGMTQRDVAEMSGVNVSNIARIEGGKYSVGLDVLAKIANVVGATVELVKDK